MSDLDVETSKNFCDSLGKSFGTRQDNQATLVGIINFLLSIRLVAKANDVCLFVLRSFNISRISVFLPWRPTLHTKAHTKSNFSRTPAMLKEPLKLNPL